MEIYVNISFLSIFSHFFLGFKHDFVRFTDFTRIANSKTASDDVTYQVTQNIYYRFITYLCSYCSRNS